jgi:hypothetical protein
MNMKAKPKLKQSMQGEQIRAALNAHWRASAVGDANTEQDIHNHDAFCDYPQSGERILGRRDLQALRSHHPGKPSGFKVNRILENGKRSRGDLRNNTYGKGNRNSFAHLSGLL